MISRIKNNEQKGFTLIELLVVISIIGVLSSVVLASVSTAREKGIVASAKTFASHTRSALYDDALFYFDFNDAGSLPSSSINLGILGGVLNMPASGGLSVANDSDLFKVGKQFVVASGGTSVNTYIQNSGISSAVTARKYTLTAWYKQATNLTVNTSQTPPIVGIGADGNINFTSISAGDGSVFGLMTNSAGTRVTTPVVSIKAGQWNHIALSVTDVGANQAKMDLYLNGKLASTLTVTINTTTVQYFGIGGNCCDFRAYGAIDDVAFYARSLLGADIRNIYAQGAVERALALNN